MDQAFATGAVPASVASAAKAWFLCTSRVVDRDGIAVKKTGFAGITLLSEHDADTDHLRFVGEHLDQARMRDLHKLLVAFPAHFDFLFPEPVLADNERADAL